MAPNAVRYTGLKSQFEEAQFECECAMLTGAAQAIESAIDANPGAETIEVDIPEDDTFELDEIIDGEGLLSIERK